MASQFSLHLQWKFILYGLVLRITMIKMVTMNMYSQGYHTTGKTWNVVIYFSLPGKCLEFAQKMGKIWNFNSKLGKNNLRFENLMLPN